MATDKRLDQVSTLTDFDYALIVKGDQVAKASKQQLAELVGNLLYGATNASSLATVVAGMNGIGIRVIRELDSNDDLDNIKTDGFYSTRNENNPSNMPADVYNNIILQITTLSRLDKWQFLASYNSNQIFYRAVSWGYWKSLLNEF